MPYVANPKWVHGEGQKALVKSKVNPEAWFCLGGERDSAKSKLRILKLEFALKRRTAKDGMVIPTRLWYPQIWTPIENIKELGESGNGIV